MPDEPACKIPKMEVEVVPKRSREFPEMLLHKSESKIFVDRSKFIQTFIEELSPSTKPLHVVAPSQFGKSTNLSMLENFFQVQVKDNRKKEKIPYKETFNYKLFSEGGHIGKPLKIMEDEEFIESHMAKYPVITFNFVRVEVTNMLVFKKSLSTAIREALAVFSFIVTESETEEAGTGESKSSKIKKDKATFEQYLDSKDWDDIEDTYFTNCGQTVLQHLSTHFGSRCIVLVDEFSAIPQALLEKRIEDKSNSKGEEKSMMNLYGKFLGSILKGNKCLKAGFLTGIIAHASGATVHCNNIQTKYFTESKKLAEYFALTEDDVRDLCSNGASAISEDVESFRNELKTHFDGYKVQGSSGMRLYATRCVVECIQEGRLITKLWAPGVEESFVEGAFSMEHPVGQQVVKLMLGKLDHIEFKKQKKLSVDDLTELREQLQNLNKGYHGMESAGGSQPVSGQEQAQDHLIQYLYELGYFTATEMEADVTKVVIPNAEVNGILRAWYCKSVKKKWVCSTQLVKGLVECLKEIQLTPDWIDKFVDCLTNCFGSCSENFNSEANYEAILFAHLYPALHIEHQYTIGSRISDDLRRLDLFMKIGEKTLIVENRYEKTSDDAIKSAVDRGYTRAFTSDHDNFILGINYTGTGGGFSASLLQWHPDKSQVKNWRTLQSEIIRGTNA